MSSTLLSRLIYFTLCLCYVYLQLVDFVEGQPAKKGGRRKLSGKNKNQPKGKAKGNSNSNLKPPGTFLDEHKTGLYFCLVAFLLCFVPSILVFLYNVLRDPLTPTLISNASKMVQTKTFSYLSKSKRIAQEEKLE